ncbi:MAG: hypothetical protein HKN80_11805 [Acidimicrobiia bacterium]|nr:hypothetical protein [Acidimicrobiia bacterium]
MDFIDRSSWSAVAGAFSSFFTGLGAVAADDRRVSFSAPGAGTGLTLSRDGTSESFMPLHEMGGRWDRVAFHADDQAVVVEGDGFSYTYRIPPALLNG